ncbi:signal recognition particle-docking protein FtsY [Leucobacter chinensis]|uniref:signal recognition particle-docking protein FtsY n=1 Tax=Leucobacter chinensis TaxID=2851010 RepID=UPI001C211C4F|nr:signal recognition particle-docking protein FtsY [Leucobacter chinensis]
MSQEKSWSFGSAFRNLFGGGTPKDVPQPITDETWDDIETALITADFGPEIAEGIIDDLRADAKRLHIDDARELRSVMRDAIEERLAKFDPTLSLKNRPAVILVVGVNGVGKTTTIGKVANYLRSFDKRVILGAADTFRAAAVEQLGTWAERSGADIVKPEQQGQDPASVAFQTVQRAIEGNYDVAIIDTAGRLQTKSGLMDELGKIRRVIEKQADIAEVLLVLDATTGQNGLAQAEAFLEVAGVTGLVLTKLDGSARGGFVLAVQQETGLPIKLVGQGEGMGDLTGFTPHVFAAQLVG